MAKLKQVEQQQVKSNGKLYAWLILLPLLIISLLFSNKAVDVVLLPKFIAFTVFAILINALALKNNAAFNEIKKHPFFKLYASYVLTSLLSVYISCNFGDAIFEWLKIFLLGNCIFAVSIYFYFHNKFIHQFVNAINILNAAIVTIGIIQFLLIFSKQNVSHTATYEVTATFGHKNIFAEMLFLTFPFTLYNLFTKSDKWKWISGVSAFLTLLLITLTLTRAVWLATLAGLLISFPFYFYGLSKGKKIKIQFKKYKKNILLIAVLCFAIISGILIYSRIDSFNTIKMQTITISSFKYGSVGERFQLWKKSINVFKESPIIGKGLGSWKIEVLKYGHQGLETENNITFHQRPHNDFIWIAAEQGILGILTYLGVVSLMLLLLIKLIINSENDHEKLFYFLALYAYSGYLIYACLSFPKERVEHQIILVFIFSIVIIKSSKSAITNSNSDNVFWVFIPLILMAGYALKVGVSRFNSEIHLHKAYTARSNGAWQNTIDEIEKAENSNYNIDPMCTPLRWYSGSAHYNLGNQELAFADFSKAYQINPHHVHVINNLATAYEIKGNHIVAIDLYKKAIHISPSFEEAKTNLCATYFNAGQKQNAFIEFQKLKVDTSDLKYRKMLNLILCQEISRMSDSISCDPIKNMLKAIFNTPPWYLQIYVKSKSEKVSFNKQLIDDAIFTLDSTEKRINFAYIKSLQKKYTTKKITND
ncbi:MAG TPA: O-antigen ligase family protein [Bacteroidia bacterium]|nr:O-antigen ligase family protein [Bacteroidia bacterium]